MIRGGLFTRFFLEEGVVGTDEWRALDDTALDSMAAGLRAIFDAFEAGGRPSEAATEHGLIFPIVAALGWTYIPQVGAGEGKDRDKPDALLFASTEAKGNAAKKRKEPDRYAFATIVQENKAWRVDLDRATGGEGSAPSSQLLRYLRRADSLSDGAIEWGLLTNGRLWRIYSTRARSRSEGYLEIDLPSALGILAGADTDASRASAAKQALKLFALFFRRDAFLPTGPGGLSFVHAALDQGRRTRKRSRPTCRAPSSTACFPDW
jgi:hypothetical protein